MHVANWKPYCQYYSINDNKIGKGAFGVVFKAHSIKGIAQKMYRGLFHEIIYIYPCNIWITEVVFEHLQDKNEVVAIKKVNKEKVNSRRGLKMQIDFNVDGLDT